MAIIIFDEDTDYEEVEFLVRDRYADLTAYSPGCCGKCNDKDLWEVAKLVLSIDINKAADDTIRYQHAVKAAYYYLFVTCC